MSGIEILGIATSVLQIADLGGKLSVKLFVFSRKIKNADKSIDSISQDIAATGAVLQQLGNELAKDEHLKLCTEEAISTAQRLVDDCNKIFLELDDALDGGISNHTLILGWKQRLKYPFLEPQIELLRSNLERLKSSLVVMLNVLIFAGQLRSQETLEVLKDQKELVKTLVEDKNASEKKYQLALKTIGWTATGAPSEEATGEAVPPPPTEVAEPAPEYSVSQTNFVSDTVSTDGVATTKPLETPPIQVWSLPSGLRYRSEEIQHHCALIKSLLTEVSAVQYQIDHGFRDRLYRGVLGAHWEQWAPLRELYGDEALINAFSRHPEVVRFWVSKLEVEALDRLTNRRNILSIRDLTPVEGTVEMLHPSAVAVPGPSIGSRSSDTALRASSDREPAYGDKRGPIEVKRVSAAISADSGVVKLRDHASALSPGGRPTLDDVLNNRAPQPYTLSAFMAYLSQQHCLETLTFTLDAKKYREKYNTASAYLADMPLNCEGDEGDELQQEWTRILNIYIEPGAPQEINLPSEERDELLHWFYGVKPPPPEALEPSVKRMHDLMSESIFIPFCNSLRPVSYAQTHAAFSDFGGRKSQLDPSRSTLDERRNMQQRVPPRRRHSPPAISNTFDLSSRGSQPSHRYTQSSTLSSALNRVTSNRLLTSVFNSPTTSGPEYALTDDNGSGDSPGPAEPRIPPTTPPTSDVTPKVSGQMLAQSPPQSGRSDSGSWKKMGYKLGRLYGPDSTKIDAVNGMAAYGDLPIENPSLASTDTKTKLKTLPEKPSGANINSSPPAKKTSSIEENCSNANGKSASPLSKAASSDYSSSLRTEFSTCVEIGQAAAAADRAERRMTDALGGPSLPLGNPPMPDDTVPQTDHKAPDLPPNVKSTVARPPAPNVLQTVHAEMSAPDTSSRQKIKGRPPIAAVGRVGAAITGLYKNKKWSRKKSAAEETLHRKEVEEYGFNPNNDPTLPSARVGLYPQGYYAPTAEATAPSTLVIPEVKGLHSYYGRDISRERYPANAMTTKSSIAERSKYQFEADSEDEVMEAEMEADFDVLISPASHLAALPKVTGAEIEAQKKHIERIAAKIDRVDDRMTWNTECLKRIDGGMSVKEEDVSLTKQEIGRLQPKDTPSTPQPRYENTPPYEHSPVNKEGVAESYGSYSGRRLSIEEEGEEIMATKQEIRFMKQQDVSSTRNALRMAAQAEQTGRNTLSRPGAHGELDVETGENVNIPAYLDQHAEAKVSELSGSLWDVHGKDTSTAKQRRERQDEEITIKRETEQPELYSKAAFDQRTNTPTPTQSSSYVSNMRAQAGTTRVNGPSGPETDRPLEQQLSHWFPQSTTLGSKSRARMPGAPRPVPFVDSNATTPMRLSTHEVPTDDDKDRTRTEDTTFPNEDSLRRKANTRPPSRPTISIYSPAMGAYVEPRPYSLGDDIPRPAAPGPEKFSSWAAARASPPSGFYEDLPSPKWDSDMSSGHSEPTGEAQEAQNHGSEESKLFPKDIPSSSEDPTLAWAPSSEMELAKDQDAHYSVQDRGNLTAWSGGPNANSSHEDDRGEHTEARKEPEHTSESEPGDATMSHVGGKGDGNFDLVDNLLMQWTKLSEDEYLATTSSVGET